ncbi:hypothetical protein FGO68_gene16736 [Halteria grandinella]|uniref:Ribosomal protein n=1 Tax=Halteria grandinella TaxID=5974 RepID=A0A8J8NIA8_HALGN|nr:hypothetical protein FGO68_gene16736 [Halteria grandinella]
MQITAKTIDTALEGILNPIKKRKFLETIELQIGLKDYDPQRDKRFNGSIRLPNSIRQKLKICIIADAKTQEQATDEGLIKDGNVNIMNYDQLRAFNKQKKVIKKWQKSYKQLMCSESLIRQIPRVMGPQLGKIGTFPQTIGPNDNLAKKIIDSRSTIKFQLKKWTCLSATVGDLGMTQEELRQNIMMALSFLVSKLKKGWGNLKQITLKSTMGKPFRLLG